MRILAADRDSVTLDALENMLRALDCAKMDRAMNAEEVLAAITGAGPGYDCLLLSCGLDGSDGTGLVSRIRALPGCADLAILFLCAPDDRDSIARAIAAGAWDYVAKPIAPFELEARLNAIALRRAEIVRLRDHTQNRLSEGPVPMTGKIRGGMGDTIVELTAFGDMEALLPADLAQSYLMELERHLGCGLAAWRGALRHLGSGCFAVRGEALPLHLLEEVAERAALRAARMLPDGAAKLGILTVRYDEAAGQAPVAQAAE